MSEAPRGQRKEPQEYYRDPDRALSDVCVPDRVTSSCMGYFRIPAIWLGGEPTDNASENELVQKNVLSNGVTINAFRNGYFVFDFRSSEYGPQIFVPGYSYPEPTYPHRRPTDTERAVRAVKKSLIERARIINVHQCLFSQAERDVARRSALAGFPISPSDLSRSISVEGCLDFQAHAEKLHCIARSYLGGVLDPTAKLTRRVVEREVAARAADLLEHIINVGGPKAISLLDQLFVAQKHGAESRSGIALVSIWAVIEYFVLEDWSKSLDARSLSHEHRKKLKGRDFSSSIILEFLNAMGIYDDDLFKALDKLRRARNVWMHELKEPSSRDLHLAGTAVRKLIERHFHFDLEFHVPNYSGGDAEWPIWMDKQALGKF